MNKALMDPAVSYELPLSGDAPRRVLRNPKPAGVLLLDFPNSKYPHDSAVLTTSRLTNNSGTLEHELSPMQGERPIL